MSKQYLPLLLIPLALLAVYLGWRVFLADTDPSRVLTKSRRR
jgi:hypothetical protein